MSSARNIPQAILIVFCTVCFVASMSLGLGGTALAAKKKTSKGPRLFGTLEFKGKIKKLPKWSGVLTKMKA